MTLSPIGKGLLLSSLLLGPVSGWGAEPVQYRRSLERYLLPEVTVVNQDAQRLSLATLVGSTRPVVVSFVCGGCGNFAPVLSATFENLQRRLGPQAARLVSLSLDPDHDTPEAMRQYLARFQAREGWDFCTASRDDMEALLRAFDAWVPNKVAQPPLTFIRSPGAERWVRIYGIMNADQLAAEIEKAGAP